MSSGPVARLEARVARLEAEGTILRRLVTLPAGGPERERVYRFIEANAVEFPVAVLCEVAEVSRSAYYAWRSMGTPSTSPWRTLRILRRWRM